ncbi:chromosome-associated kinesin KIF4A-like isoform X2 [Gordionus sp. m RMFG-2023]|uniref:chromosome-associated kinesin KIF4A-like isoform X2 n=1 Tax=Gordionus sp. m RMFG-2023 TaxID=3053472 RepID=UPI0031FBEAF5
MNDKKIIPVKVVLRCRPLINKEIESGHEECVEINQSLSQVVIGVKSFTFDYVFGQKSTQSAIYTSILYPLLKKAFEGYNLTILAYGQTGSGKTHTMGTDCFSIPHGDIDTSYDIGLIPKAINDVFKYIKNLKSDVIENVSNCVNIDFRISVSFLEIYKEEIIDLLNSYHINPKDRDKETVVIREDPNYGIRLIGLKEIPVSNFLEALSFLEMGSAIRSTASTAMNLTSSRSHAIFTITIEKFSDDVTLTKSKIHFVDLAGSERVKKTLAEGERFKEGVNINRGLLALGNVINALSEDSKKKGENGFVPYRDSKLTRILQDSLGGNSHTVMIACVSPSLFNVEETLNTLRYADRAKKIKNKPVINIDPYQEELSRLRNRVRELEEEISLFRNNKELKDHKSINGFDEVYAQSQQDNLYKLKLEKVVLEFQNSLGQNIAMESEMDLLKKELEFYRDKILKFNVESLEGKILSQQVLEKERDEYMSEFKSQLHNSLQADENNSILNGKTNNLNDVMDQVDMNLELKSLSQAISDKETLINQMQTNENEILALKERYQREVDELQSEKENLNIALLEAQRNKTLKSELSEKRRKRLLELESKIITMTKKIGDHDKLMKIKEQNKALIDKLQTDITEMKQSRVKLIRKMKEESDKFRKMKMEKDKEMIQFKSNVRKREIAYNQKEQKLKTEQIVLRRKNEEILATNKRLKDILTKRQNVLTSKENAGPKPKLPLQSHNIKYISTTNKDSIEAKVSSSAQSKSHDGTHAEDIGHVCERIHNEFEFLVCLQMAKRQIEQLCYERKELTDKLNEIESPLQETNSKKSPHSQLHSEGERESDDDEEEDGDYDSSHFNCLQKSLQYKTQQINTLKAKVEEAETSNVDWHSILHNTNEPSSESISPALLDWLFQYCLDTNLKLAIEDQNKKESSDKFADLQQRLIAFELEKQKATDIIHRENEAKINMILKQTGKIIVTNTNGSNSDEALIKKLSELQNSVLSLQAQNELYEKKLAEKETQIYAYEEEFENIKKKSYPIKMFTPVGIRVKKNPRNTINRLTDTTKRKSKSYLLKMTKKRESRDNASNQSSSQSENSLDSAHTTDDEHQELNETFLLNGNATKKYLCIPPNQCNDGSLANATFNMDSVASNYYNERNPDGIDDILDQDAILKGKEKREDNNVNSTINNKFIRTKRIFQTAFETQNFFSPHVSKKS